MHTDAYLRGSDSDSVTEYLSDAYLTHRSGWSSSPDIQNANIDREVTTPRIRISTRP